MVQYEAVLAWEARSLFRDQAEAHRVVIVRPVMSAARLGEHSAVDLMFVYEASFVKISCSSGRIVGTMSMTWRNWWRMPLLSLMQAELKRRSHIDDRARAADPNFSNRIRAGLPGIQSSGDALPSPDHPYWTKVQ